MNNSALTDLLPTFMSGVGALRNDLMGVGLVICFAGLTLHICAALFRNNVSMVMPSLVRLAIVSLTISFLPQWGDTLSQAVNGLSDELRGPGGDGKAVFLDYQASIANRFGTNSIAHRQSAPVPTSEGDTSGGFTQDGNHLETPKLQMPSLSETIGDAILGSVTLAVSWVATAVLWCMRIAQQILYLIELAVSPALVACLMVPALAHLARNFFLTFVGIVLWPLAWILCDLLTKAFVDLAVSQNAAIPVWGPLTGLGLYLIIALWVIASSILAPFTIGILFNISGSSATAVLFGSIGRSVAGISNSASRSFSVACGAPGAPAGGSVNSQIDGSPSMSVRTGGINFARRPGHPESEPEPYRPPLVVHPVQSTMRMNPNNGSGRVKRLGADQISDV